MSMSVLSQSSNKQAPPKLCIWYNRRGREAKYFIRRCPVARYLRSTVATAAALALVAFLMAAFGPGLVTQHVPGADTLIHRGDSGGSGGDAGLHIHQLPMA